MNNGKNLASLKNDRFSIKKSNWLASGDPILWDTARWVQQGFVP
jgi:hypothetical protein